MLLLWGTPAAAAVDLVTGPQVPSAARGVVVDTWAQLNEHWWRVTSTPPPWNIELRVVSAASLPTQVAAHSRPGVIELRTSSSTSLTSEQVLALRHEVVHQHLWASCPQRSRDRLFHEAIAVALSGEAAVWDSERYQTLPQTLSDLQTSDLDTPRARRALARLVRESSTSTGVMRVPAVLQHAMRDCADDIARAPLQPTDLAALDDVPTADVLVVINRHSGELVEQQGPIDLPLPFGSTLKPFLLAAALDRGVQLPRLPRRAQEPTWACGAATSSTMTASEALQFSCNGWFLDFAARDPQAHTLGAWGELLTSLGLSALPADMSEAIGARSSLRLSAMAMAQAWRALALRPAHGLDVVDVLRTRGTLLDAPGVAGLDGMAAKTGTVRNAQSQPVLGWLVAVDDDLVIVRVRSGAPARTLASDVAAARTRHRRRHQQPVQAQVFGLLDDVQVSCAVAVVVDDRGPHAFRDVRGPLRPQLRTQPFLCLSGPWLVDVAGMKRPYAGTFTASPLLKSTTSQAHATPRQAAARRGSSIVFGTSRVAYVRGVLVAEDSQLRGEARVALARVIDHNVDHSVERHPGRAVCDTTHCQTFPGTAAPIVDVDRALAQAVATPLPYRGWLPFSQGGSEPWQQQRRRDEVVSAVGAFDSLVVRAGHVVLTRVSVGPDGAFDEPVTLGCEALRNPLRLPSCPESVTFAGSTVRFAGHGAGHGLGLSVENARAAAATGTTADRLLEEAYGASGGQKK